MKKFLRVLCAATLLLVSLYGVSSAVKAAPGEDEWDTVFREALEEVIIEEGITADEIKIAREPVYDLDLAQLGFIYFINYDGTDGYALVINTRGMFDVVEFYPKAASPYKDYEGEKVYVGFLMYLVHNGGEYTDTETGKVLKDKDVDVLREKAFYSAQTGATQGYETVYYTNKSVDDFKLARRHPAYFPSGYGMTNACTPAAGANVIGYWTRYYPELMPGFTPGSVAFGQYLYKEEPSEADALVKDLYDAMKTNVTAPGTTVQEFRTGMNAFVERKGRKIGYESCKIGNSFSYSTAQQKLKSGIPLVLFVDCFRVDEFDDLNNEMALSYLIQESAHAMAGFGYNQTTYYLSDGTQRTDTYIQVATGLGEKSKGFYNINYNTTIDECFAVTVY